MHLVFYKLFYLLRVEPFERNRGFSPGGVYWTKFECISGKIRRILTNDTCATHAPFGRDPISAFCGNSRVHSHFATTSHRPFAFAHNACLVVASCSLCGFSGYTHNGFGYCRRRGFLAQMFNRRTKTEPCTNV